MRNQILTNRYLPHFDFDLSNIAFVIQCSNLAADSFLRRNPHLIRPGYEQPVQTSPSPEEDDPDRATPCVDNNSTAWLFPVWNPHKVWYIFGTSKSDITLSNEKYVSRKHFGMHLGQDGNWIVRNISQFGTYVNGDFLTVPEDEDLDRVSCADSRGSDTLHCTGDNRTWISSQQALIPDVPNAISAGRLEFMIHPMPHIYIPLSADSDSRLSLLSVSTLGRESRTSDATTIGSSAWSYQPISPRKENYYYLEDKRIDVQGKSEVFMAIHKQTGKFYVAKSYDLRQEEKARLQYEMVKELKDLQNIVPYHEFIETEDSFKIITPYLDVEPLADALGRQTPEIELSFLVYKHIARALCSLEENGIVHNNINENTILIGYEPDRYTAYLTGFSEFSKASADSEDGFRRDLSSLSSIVEKTLPTYKGQTCCEPGLRSLMFPRLEAQLSASQICLALEAIAPDYESCPFKTLWIRRVVAVKRIVDEDDAEAVRLLDFLRIVLHHNPEYLKITEHSIREVIRIERLFPLDGETYCYLRDAEKLLHHLKHKGVSPSLDLSPPTHRDPCWYETEHDIYVPVSYHEPSGMVNITRILNLFDDETARSCVQGINPTTQEVRGPPQWEGFYIDKESLDEIMGRLTPRIKLVSPALRNPSPSTFYSNDTKRYIIVAAREMVGLIFLSRDGTTVRWNAKTQEVGSAIRDCEIHGMFPVRSTICRLAASLEEGWASFHGDEEIMELFDKSECPSEATSHNSFDDQLQDTRFKPRKRKGLTNVPSLPRPRCTQSSVPQITSRAKCESWNDDQANL